MTSKDLGCSQKLPLFKFFQQYSLDVCIVFMCVVSPLVVSDSLWTHGLNLARLLCPWGFSRQEYWSGSPCPTPGGLPNPGIKPRSPHCHIYMSTSKNRRKKKQSKRKMSGLSGFATFKEKWYTGSWCLSQKLIWSRKTTGFVPFLFLSPTCAFLLFYRTLRQWSIKP